MSYYRPSFSQTISMSRGRGFSTRGSSFRGNSRGGYGTPRGRFSQSPYDSRSRYGSSDRYSGRNSDEFRKPYRSDYSNRERSPERKRPRSDGYSSRHESSSSSYGSYGSSSRHEPTYSERRSFSGERPPIPYSRKEEFRRPSIPPPRGGGYRGRINTRGTRGLRFRDRLPPRRRLLAPSYGIHKRVVGARSGDFVRRLKISKLRSAMLARRAKQEGESDNEDKEEDEENGSEKEEDEEMGEAKSPKKESDSEKQDDKTPGEETKPKKTFIKLQCPHCNVKTITFRRYDQHLISRSHMLAMRRVAMKQKAILAQMRQAQRSAQNELEKSSEDLQTKTNFCPLCKLNYKQKKSVHQASDSHKNMKKFLMPFCKVCSITFKSPMIYESHCCSIEHMKRKQRMENGNSDESGQEDLENFTTIDSVGDLDEEESGDKKEDVKEPINVGIEKIRKVEAHYCDLCRMYLPRGEEGEMSKILARHCKLRVHMQRYIRYKEDKDLEKKAEKLQRKETAEKADKVKVKGEKKDGENAKEDGEIESSNKEDEDTKDDKMWADVDKDLGDILAAEDDDDDESHAQNKERYDRFKSGEKGEDNLKDLKEGAESAPVANGLEETKKE